MILPRPASPGYNMLTLRQGFCQMFCTSKIPEIFNFTPKKRVNCDIFGKTCECRMLYSYFLRKNAIFFVNFFSKTKSLHLFCEKVKPEFGKFHKNFHVNSLKLFIIQIPCLRVDIIGCRWCKRLRAPSVLITDKFRY